MALITGIWFAATPTDQLPKHIKTMTTAFQFLATVVAMLNVPLMFIKIRGVIKHHTITNKLNDTLELKKTNDLLKAAKTLNKAQEQTANEFRKLNKSEKHKTKIEILQTYLLECGISSHTSFLINLLEAIERKAPAHEIKSLIFAESCQVLASEKISHLKKIFS